MTGFNCVASEEVGDGAGEFDGAVVSAGRELEGTSGAYERTFRFWRQFRQFVYLF